MFEQLLQPRIQDYFQYIAIMQIAFVENSLI